MKAYIPPNLDQSGGVLGGILQTRNAIEAAAYVGFIVVLFKFILFFLPEIVSILAGGAIALMGGLFFLIGIGGQPVSIAVFDRLIFRKTKGVFTLKMPAPYQENPAKKARFLFKRRNSK